MHTWKPNNCSLPAFDAHKFCDALGPGRIHLFGDSQMQQASATLMNMLIGGHQDGEQHCTPQVTFHLSDYLIGAPDERGEVASFDKYDGDIYILGLGAWVHNRKKYSDTIDIMYDKIKKRLSEPNPPMFIWKTVSGAGCGPINTIAVDHADPSYTYDLFPTYDAMAREKLSPLGVKFIDLSPLYLRGDAHPTHQGDCLHFCAPGPVDIFPRLLHHVMQEHAEVPSPSHSPPPKEHVEKSQTVKMNDKAVEESVKKTDDKKTVDKKTDDSGGLKWPFWSLKDKRADSDDDVELQETAE